MLALYTKSLNLLQNLKNEAGQDSVEYAILIGIVATGITVSVGTVNTYVSNAFTALAAAL